MQPQRETEELQVTQESVGSSGSRTAVSELTARGGGLPDVQILRPPPPRNWREPSNLCFKQAHLTVLMQAYMGQPRSYSILVTDGMCRLKERKGNEDNVQFLA